MLSTQFIKSATQRSQYPKSHLPSVAFVGRSNVGKSSLINCLVGKKNLARTSSTPGRTQVINFFNIDDRWILVDLPGYGFAKVPVSVREKWAGMIEEFLQGSENLKLTVAIVDARHKPSPLDIQMIEWLEHFQVPYQVVATKVDKLSGNQRQKSLKLVRETLKTDDVIPFSALSGQGKKEIWKILEELR